MSKKRKPSKKKKINPHFWVFCEGKTEEAYVKFLRSYYRIPIEIVSKIVGNKISERIINNYKKGKPTHKKDIDFLMYDADIIEVLEKLKKIESAVLLASNPSIELWFLLHYKNQTATLSTNDCIRELSNRNRNEYKKGEINYKLKEKLKERHFDACKKAKRTKLFNNPSTNIYILIDKISEAKRGGKK